MGSALPNQLKAKLEPSGLDFAGLENGSRAQRLSDLDGMCSYELGFEPGLAVLKQHLYDLLQIGQEFIDRRALRMCARPARNMAHVGPGVAVPFYNCRIATHGNLPIRKLLYNNKLHGSGPSSPCSSRRARFQKEGHSSATDDAKALGTRPPSPLSPLPSPRRRAGCGDDGHGRRRRSVPIRPDAPPSWSFLAGSSGGGPILCSETYIGSTS